jgi:hypothetical protein
MPTDPSKAIEAVQALLSFLFSWIVLLGIGVIISGKLARQCISLGFADEAEFSINLGAFKIGAKGDEVSLGFILFFLALATVIIVGGDDAHLFLKNRAGLDVGQWNSVCVVASFISIVVAVAAWLYSRLGTPPTIINQSERERQLERLDVNQDGR